MHAMRRFQTAPGFLRHHALQGLLTGVLAFCCVVALALIELAISRRSASELISETARAEFGAADQNGVDASSRYAQR
jgi:hypothetical protein